jgi:hypothetical protein
MTTYPPSIRLAVALHELPAYYRRNYPGLLAAIAAALRNGHMRSLTLTHGHRADALRPLVRLVVETNMDAATASGKGSRAAVRALLLKFESWLDSQCGLTAADVDQLAARDAAKRTT